MKIPTTRCRLVCAQLQTHTNSSTPLQETNHKEGVSRLGRKRLKALTWVGKSVFPRWALTLSGNALSRCHSGEWEHWELFPSRPQQTHPAHRPRRHRVHGEKQCWKIKQRQLGKHFLTTMSALDGLCCSTGICWSYTNKNPGEGRSFFCVHASLCCTKIVTKSHTRTDTRLSSHW